MTDKEALAKQEHGEPVAGYYFPLTNETMRGSIEALIAHAKRARWTDAIVRKDGVETKYEADWIKKLVPYTTPQQRPWVELMDKDVQEVLLDFPRNFQEWYDRDFVRYTKAIEAKLKELNT